MVSISGRAPATGTFLVIAGGGLLSLSVFLPWVHIIIFGDLSLMQLADLSHRHTLAILMVLAGGTAAFVALVYKERIRLRFWTSVIAASIGLFVGIDIIHSLNQDGAFIKIENGGYLAILAGLLLLAGVIPDLKR